MVYALIFAICVFISACSQLLLKRAANRGYIGLKVYLNKEVIIGYAIFLCVTFVTLYLYKHIQLSTGALLESLSYYIFIPLISLLFLKEKISKKKLLGIGLILSGVIIYSIGGVL
jgi:drug/metabolite transporter (DMT)-like permease